MPSNWQHGEREKMILELLSKDEDYLKPIHPDHQIHPSFEKNERTSTRNSFIKFTEWVNTLLKMKPLMRAIKHYCKHGLPIDIKNTFSKEKTMVCKVYSLMSASSLFSKSLRCNCSLHSSFLSKFKPNPRDILEFAISPGRCSHVD